MRYAALPIRFASKIKDHASSTRANVAAKTFAVLLFTAATLSLPAAAQTAGTYSVTNLVSDGSVPATVTDANFINPWGVTNATFWVNTQGTGLDYVLSPTNFPPFPPLTPPATPAF